MTATATYSGISQRAKALLARKGATVTFSDPYGGTATWTAPGVQIEDDPQSWVARGIVVQNPITLLVSAEGATSRPKNGQNIAFGGVTYTVLTFEPIAPDGGEIAWTVVGSA